jgi:hypothetical protein
MCPPIEVKLIMHRIRSLPAVTKADQGFKSLIGAYNTEVLMLKWKNERHRRSSRTFSQELVTIPSTITQQYAKKAKVDASDGLIIEGGGMYLPVL